MDIRSKKTEPFALSENQEDELLSMTSIKGCVFFISLEAPMGFMTCVGGNNSRVGCLLNFLFVNLRSRIDFAPILDTETVNSDTKVVVGTQTGVLSIFNRNSGWGDCVDRVPGYVHRLTILMIPLHIWYLGILIQ